ncbi:MAG: class II aldolase/adducin family protein, partial [Chloroflexia bacterium]
MAHRSPDPRTRLAERLQRLREWARSGTLAHIGAGRGRALLQGRVTDLDLDFYLGLRAGEVVAGLGASPEPADGCIETDSATLGLLLAAPSGGAPAPGWFSFRGDMELLRALVSLLPGLSQPEAPVHGRPEEVLPEDPRREMVQVVEELYRQGLITASGGNISVRIEGEAACWITPRGLFKGGLCPDLMVRIDLNGNPLQPEGPAPSSEWPMHTALYRARPEVRAVVHAHAPYATVLALCGLPFLPVTAEAALLGEVPTVPFVMPGTQELARTVAEALGHGTACIL